MAKLVELERNGPVQHVQVTHLFFCPGCQSCHGVSETIWTITGTPDSPTIRASVLCTYEPHKGPKRICHSYVTDGRIEFLSDSTHRLAGQTVDLPDFEDW